MRSLPLALFLCALCLAICASSGYSQNLLQNGGFESGSLNPWGPGLNFDGQVWTISTDNPHSGSYCATVSGNDELRQNFAPLAVSQIGQVTFWTRQVISEFSNYHLAGGNFDYADGTTSNFQVIPSSAWQKFDVTKSLTPGETLSGISIFGLASVYQAQTYYDDMKIQPVPELSSLVSFCLPVLGLGSLLLRARKKNFGRKMKAIPAA